MSAKINFPGELKKTGIKFYTMHSMNPIQPWTMHKKTYTSYILRGIHLLLAAMLAIGCTCNNPFIGDVDDAESTEYLGKGEVTEDMVADVAAAIETYIQKHPELAADSIRKEFSPLLETLQKLQGGAETTDISESAIDGAIELGKPAVIQAFIDITKRDGNEVKPNLRYKLKAARSIIRMKISHEQFIREIRADYEAIERDEQVKNINKLVKEQQEQEESNTRRQAFLEGMLQEQVQRRLAAEQGIRIIHPGKCFVAYFSKSYVRRTKSYIQDFQEDLAANPLQQGLAPEQQKEAALIVNRIAKEVKKIQGAREDIAYFVAHPEAITGVNSRVSYDNADLEIADQLLAELQGCQEEMRQILAERGKDVADYEKKSDVETQEEKAAYRALEEALNDVSDTDSLVTTSQQAMKELLDKKGTDNSQDSALQPAAMQLATQVGGIIAMFKAKQEAINKLYFAAADISDYVNRPIAQGIQAVQTLNTAIDTLHSSFIHFYGQFDIDEDDIKPEPESVITKAVLKSSFKKLLAQLVPGSELVQAVLGSRPLPQNPEEWANLAVPAGFDFIPYHKTLKRLAGPDNPALQQQIKALIMTLLKKRSQRARKTYNTL